MLGFKVGNCEQSGRRESDQEALHMNGFGKWSGWRMDTGMQVLRPVDRKGVACLGGMRLSFTHWEGHSGGGPEVVVWSEQLSNTLRCSKFTL